MDLSDLDLEIQRIRRVWSIPFELVKDELPPGTLKRAKILEAAARERERKGIPPEGLNLLSTVLKNPLPNAGWPMPQPKDEDSEDDYILAETEEEWKEWKRKKDEQRAERAAAKITTPRPALGALRQEPSPVKGNKDPEKRMSYGTQQSQEERGKKDARRRREQENGTSQSFQGSHWERDPSLRVGIYQALSPIAQLGLHPTDFSSSSQLVHTWNTSQPALPKQSINASIMNKTSQEIGPVRGRAERHLPSPYGKKAHSQSQPLLRSQIRSAAKPTIHHKSQQEMLFPSPSTTQFLYGSPEVATPRPTTVDPEPYAQEIQDEIEGLDQGSEIATFGRQLLSPPRTSTTGAFHEYIESQDDGYGITQGAEELVQDMEENIGSAYREPVETVYTRFYTDPYDD